MARQDSKPRRARSGWDVLTGLGAIVVLLVLLIGPPVALITVFGLPIPHAMPSASLLTHRLQAATVLRACSVVVWLAWLQLVWCVVAEVSAAVRNVGMPRRVPLAGGMQALVHRLVTTALLVSTAAAAAPALAPAAALAATPPAATARRPPGTPRPAAPSPASRCHRRCWSPRRPTGARTGCSAPRTSARSSGRSTAPLAATGRRPPPRARTASRTGGRTAQKRSTW